MRKMFIWGLAVVLLACGVVEEPETAPMLQRADLALQEETLACTGLYCPAGQYSVGYECNLNCGHCTSNYNQARCTAPVGKYTFVKCGIGCLDDRGNSLGHWLPSAYGYDSSCRVTIGSDPVHSDNQTTCINYLGLETFSYCNSNRGSDEFMLCPAGFVFTDWRYDTRCDAIDSVFHEPNRVSCLSILKSMSLDSSRISLSHPIKGTVHLNTNPTGVWVHLDSVPHNIHFSASRYIPPGQLRLDFWSYVRFPVAVETPVKLTASLGLTSREASLTIEPTPGMESLTLEQSTVTGPGVVKGSATLSFNAPVGGTGVSVSSSHPQLVTVRTSTSTIPQGARRMDFKLEVSSVHTPTTVRIYANGGYGETFRDTTLTILPALSPGSAIVHDPRCNARTVSLFEPPPHVQLPFPINFFGTTYSHLFVNIDGNVSFLEPIWGASPFVMTAQSPPIIAPFLAITHVMPWEEEHQVRYSDRAITFEGRPAFCVNWNDVMYELGKTDNLNDFQLLLVDRSDMGTGDFDIVMNYDRIQWESGHHPGGEVFDGLGDPSASVGYSAGNGQSKAFYSFPGSLLSGSFLDSNFALGLTRTKHNSSTLGRHIFQVRNGLAPREGRIAGTVTNDATPPRKLAGALVQVCSTTGERCAVVTRTDAGGHYSAPELPAGNYRVTVFPPEGSPTWHNTVGPVHLADGANVEVNVTLPQLKTIPVNTSLSPSKLGAGGVPTVYSGDPLTLWTQGCPKGRASYQVVRLDDTLVTSGVMTEEKGWPGYYRAQLPKLAVLAGFLKFQLRIQCPDATVEKAEFGVRVYIDPSGTVRTLSGKPVPDARVTLYRADSASGPFEVVPDGSALMSPDNRRNWDVTDEQGRFRWDVIDGYYRVRAEREGCLAASGAPYVETEVLPVPPPVTDLDLRLDCPGLEDTTPPASTASLSTAPNVHGWHNAPVTIQLVATDADSSVESITYSLSGVRTGGASVPGDRTQVTLSTEGTTVLTWFARDAAGNAEAPQVLELRLDMMAPSLSCQAALDSLTRPNHALVPVQVDVRLGDTLSGSDSFILKAATSNEPEDGLGDGDTLGDLQQWEVGTADTQGLLRAERSGKGTGRVYTMTYEGRDRAGNVATCSAVVGVPHDRRR